MDVPKTTQTNLKFIFSKLRINNLIRIFRQYPDIFPNGYFRFLGARLSNHIDKDTLWYRDGVILTWNIYVRTSKKYSYIKPGDVKLDQLVNKNQGSGKAKEIIGDFLKTQVSLSDRRLWVEVSNHNKRAIQFYSKLGFQKYSDIQFGDIQGCMMELKCRCDI